MAHLQQQCVILLVLAAITAIIIMTNGTATNDRLQVKVVKRASDCGMRSQNGDTLHVHYTGTFENGTLIDTSRGKNAPFTVTLGLGHVISGYEQGLLDMCEGEQRRIIVPPELGYGDQGHPANNIPPGATLKFDVELLRIERRDEL